MVSRLITELLAGKPGFGPEFSDCYLILHPNTACEVHATQVLGVREMEKTSLQVISTVE